ncbi:hypothetical protein IR022_06295 [Dysgonomonas sp. GY617]|nr:RHS repeat-associated core domain-containing protein [Dysgonomonas sp. GY617]MBF0575574.1 hypothetical protein [Dysgonomonas sp. GY617]
MIISTKSKFEFTGGTGETIGIGLSKGKSLFPFSATKSGQNSVLLKIYIGSQRIVSKLGDLDSYGRDPRRIEYAGSNVDGAKVDYKAKYKQSQQSIKDNYASFEVPYYGKDNDDYVNGQGFCCDDTPRLKSFNPSQNDNPELFQYYYHSDHLGNSSLITNLDGEVAQHIEYVPFGEVFIEERNNTWNTSYLFNAKELDEETGLYYYGARYYDPRTSVWISTDPLQEKYPNKTSYHFCSQNPINKIDPDGKDDYFTSEGKYSRSTPIGNNIIVETSDGNKYPSEFKTNWNLFDWKSEARETLNNIYSYYAEKAGVGNIFKGVTKLKHDDNLAFHSGGEIWISTQKNGSVSPLFDNYYNLMSSLEHEGYHNQDDNNGIKISYTVHVKVYLKQMKSDNYKNASSEFKDGIMLNFFKYLMGAKQKKESGWKTVMEDFNESNINGGFQLRDRSSGGTQLITPDGKGEVNTLKAIGNIPKDPH